MGTSGTLLVDYEMYGVPDRMDVYYDGVNIFSTTTLNPPTGLISGAGQFVIPYGPGVATSSSTPARSSLSWGSMGTPPYTLATRSGTYLP